MVQQSQKIIDETLTVPQYQLLRRLVGGDEMIHAHEQRTVQVLERKRLAIKITDTHYEAAYSATAWLSVHTIHENTVIACDKRERISLTTVKHDYGFTDKLIKEFLPKPMFAVNPHYRSAAPMKLWFKDEVETARQQSQVQQALTVLQERRDKRAATQARKQQEAFNQFATMISEQTKNIHITTTLTYEQITQQVNDLQQETYQLQGDWDHSVQWESTSQQQQRIITYIRYHYTTYNQQLWNSDDERSNYQQQLNQYRANVLAAIKHEYPQLAATITQLQHGQYGRDDIDPQAAHDQAKHMWQQQVDRLREQIQQLSKPVHVKPSQPQPMRAAELCKRLNVDNRWVNDHATQIQAVNAHGKPIRQHKKPLYDLNTAANILRRENLQQYEQYLEREQFALNLRQQTKTQQRAQQLTVKQQQLERLLSLDQRQETAREIIPASLAATDPVRYYAKTRCVARQFILHVGPTNSGKTHDALTALMRVKSGVYLAPLRLLALEVGDQLRAQGYACSIITGEEQSVVDDAVFVSETVEMLDVSQQYDLAIVDECQMMSDEDRGGAWSRAILGLHAPIIHLCMSEDAVEIVTRLVEACGDTYEIRRHERQTPLLVAQPMSEQQVSDGDALIVFSRRNVLETAIRLESRGIRTSVIYGALPWSARREEARRFAEHESQVLVATDAIGMGLNLPIRRIVFEETSKYDGHETRMLRYGEVQQIAGRAGRRGLFPEGFVTSTLDATANSMLERALTAVLTPLSLIRVSFPRELGLNEHADLSMLLRVWANVQAVDQTMIRENIDTPIRLATWMEQQAVRSSYPLTRSQMIRLAFLPIDVENEDQFALFQCLFANLNKIISQGEHPNLPSLTGQRNECYYAYNTVPNDLWQMEQAVKMLGIRFAFAKAIGVLDKTMEERFTIIRKRYEQAIIKKISGSKMNLIERRFRYDYDDDYDDDEYYLRNYR